jgi:hypothetical protein
MRFLPATSYSVIALISCCSRWRRLRLFCLVAAAMSAANRRRRLPVAFPPDSFFRVPGSQHLTINSQQLAPVNPQPSTTCGAVSSRRSLRRWKPCAEADYASRRMRIRSSIHRREREENTRINTEILAAVLLAQVAKPFICHVERSRDISYY